MSDLQKQLEALVLSDAANTTLLRLLLSYLDERGVIVRGDFLRTVQAEMEAGAAGKGPLATILRAKIDALLGNVPVVN
jgi:hypothetical protein